MDRANGVAIIGPATADLEAWFVEQVGGRLEALGRPVHRDGGQADGDGLPPGVRVVLNAIDVGRPKGFRRRSQDIFVVGVGQLPEMPDHMLRAAYTLLVRSLSNVFITLVKGEAGPEAYIVTMEQGFHPIRHQGDDDAFFGAIVERLLPLVDSRLVINNEFHHDLPRELWGGDEHTEAMYRTGLRLGEFDLLPAPWPIDELLAPDDLRHVLKLFGIGGLSYGNVSARHEADTFWMSASGIDKSHLREVGREILLVTGYDEARSVIHLSVPEGIRPRRVSVDAVEHVMIYREHPEVGAILHVHGWMEGVTDSTEVVYPCGTHELATEVADLVRLAPDPGRAVIGLRNHGLTITGHDLDEILERVGHRIVRRVPMS
jgi:ribulose-5-phosphate 4-epimerase/fuculose-1-phosphate aldolase